MPAKAATVDYYPSRTVNPNKLFLLQVALVVVFYYSSRKVTVKSSYLVCSFFLFCAPLYPGEILTFSLFFCITYFEYLIHVGLYSDCPYVPDSFHSVQCYQDSSIALKHILSHHFHL